MNSAIGMSWVILEEQWIQRSIEQAGRPSYPSHRPARRRPLRAAARRGTTAVVARLRRRAAAPATASAAPAASVPAPTAARHPVGCAA